MHIQDMIKFINFVFIEDLVTNMPIRNNCFFVKIDITIH